jgi:hypothetical protein
MRSPCYATSAETARFVKGTALDHGSGIRNADCDALKTALPHRLEQGKRQRGPLTHPQDLATFTLSRILGGRFVPRIDCVAID